MSTLMQDLLSNGPLVIVSAAALVVLVVEALVKKTGPLSCWISLGGLVAAGGAGLVSVAEKGTAFSGMVTTGGCAAFFSVLFCVAGALSVMLSRTYVARMGIEHGEYYGLILFSVAGMILMAAAADLVILFLGLELMSVSFYVMAGFARRALVSNEAGLKYFLLGAFATGFLLYGIALLYGTSGTTSIPLIVQGIALAEQNALFLAGIGLFLIGLAFKIAAVPFHMWVPDVYEGAPTTVSGFMSTGGKAAAFSALLLLFSPAVVGGGGVPAARETLAVLAVLSMVVGNIVAIAQTSIKRMLAYSSIAHAGYILTGVVAGNGDGANGVLFYLLAYTAVNIGAFGVLSIIESQEGGNLMYDDFAGLSTRYPGLSGLMALFMFSLTGIPPFAGFFGKYYVFAGAVSAGYTWLAVVGVLMSVLSAYYYLRVVVMMYFREQTTALEIALPRLGMSALVLSAIALVVFGIYPSAILTVTSRFF